MVSRFPSKRDAWIVAVIWIGVASLVAGSVVALASAGPLVAGVALAALQLGASAFMLWVLYGTAYAIEVDAIRVRSGPFRWRVPLAGIGSVAPSKSSLSSPACSVDRLRVEYRNARGTRRVILLSPEDKSGFLAALAARCPALAQSGDRLAPRA